VRPSSTTNAPGRTDQRGQPGGEQVADHATALAQARVRPALAGGEVDQSERPHEDHHAPERGHLPAVAHLGRALDERAGDEQQHRKQQRALAEQRPEHVVDVPIEETLRGQQQRDERHEPGDEQQHADERACRLRRDREPAGGRRGLASRLRGRGRARRALTGSPAPLGHDQTSTTTGNTIGRRLVRS
jgi:hypothetical protein